MRALHPPKAGAVLRIHFAVAMLAISQYLPQLPATLFLLR